MNHWRASRLLPCLLDETLPPARERALQAHVAGCPRCQERLEALVRTEELVGRLPLCVAPLDFDPAAHRRLACLAEWSMLPALPRPGGWRAPALGMLSVALVAGLALTVGTWTPISADAAPYGVGIAPPDPASLPLTWRPGR